MFGFSLAERAESVLRRELDYVVGQMARPMFDHIAACMKGARSHDVAIIFMIVSLGALSGSPETQVFAREKIKLIRRIKHMGKIPQPVVEAKLNLLEEKLGLLSSDFRFPTWDAWYSEYRRVCAEVRPCFAPSEKGLGLFDFIDIEPLKMAFYDRVDPVPLARKFAQDFDINSFGR